LREGDSRDKGIRVIGPNTLGPINTSNNFSISFNPISKMRRGGISCALWRTSMSRNEDEWIEELESYCLPVFPSSERAIKAVAALYSYRLFLENEK
jgi:acyl-CoA synthetase (NDP forming)